MPYSKIYIDGRLLGYGDKLFEEPVKRVVIKKPRVFNLLDPISDKEKGVGWSKSSAANKGGLLRDQIDRTVKRDPEVMLKVTSKKEAGKGMKQIGNHLDYISRNGKVELETDQGEIIGTKPGIKALQEEWKQGITGKPLPEKSEHRLAINFMLSMPKGTPPDAVLTAGRAFLAETFGGKHAYVFALHTDTDKPHIHACIQVAPLGGGKRLNPRKADLSRWREQFAQQLRHIGIAANATPRRTRGVSKFPLSQVALQKKIRLAVKASEITKPSRSDDLSLVFKKLPIASSLTGAKKPFQFAGAIIAWSGIAKLLAGSSLIEDRALSIAASQFSVDSYKKFEMPKELPEKKNNGISPIKIPK
ncbi:relaxase/mobilization nuclease domain-containing protein [Polynucleobacter sp. AM-25C3]|uniref:relaxase/mobilization nuclease domain-containing protein n=1 Tax=Polynucleobacter sp. AM-25C3 TaxID=1855569 RepID=UPI001C0DE646|nr:relaxase/mobilization nuclease domain-containing protein [Polynucleobacter sp. AM-25C3]MBU3602277.1 relaxase/mobilization nuclease domain-containing protein [Polynucleobacter sp. AM-25C3]